MKASLLAYCCLCVGGLVAPAQAAPEIDTNAPVTAEDLGITKWVPKITEDKTEALIVTLRITKSGAEEFHTSTGVFDLKRAKDCCLLIYQPSFLQGGDDRIRLVRVGSYDSPFNKRKLQLSGNLTPSEGTYMPTAKTAVHYLDCGRYRIEYMIEEFSQQELIAIAGTPPTLPNGEKAGKVPLEKARAIVPDPGKSN